MDITNVFQAFAGFLGNLGFLVALPAAVICFIVGRAQSDHHSEIKRKADDFFKFAAIAFLGLEVPRVIVWFFVR